MIPLEAITRARETLAGVAVRTPLVRLRVDAPAEIYLKLECLQPIGSFKIRGAMNAMAEAPAGALEAGVVTASAGNMAQGVAWGARERGIPCTVVVPETAPQTKIDAIERLGGTVVRVPFEAWWNAQPRIETGVGLDPLTGTFTTGVSFVSDGSFNGTMTPLVTAAVPEPAALALWACGLATLWGFGRRRIAGRA